MINGFYDNMLYQNMLNDMMIQNNKNISSNELAGIYDGYLKGNMFNNLYQGYKKYKPAKLIPNNEQAELLLNLNQICFALQDIRLYLDVHPDDINMINIFNEYTIKEKECLDKYQEKYGPISSGAISNNDTFSWEAYSFPWEMEDV